MKVTWHCPSCHLRTFAPGVCVCGEPRIALGASGESVLFIGRIGVLDDGVSPASILSGVCMGPRRYPRPLEFGQKLACWQDEGKSIWMWQAAIDELSVFGSRPIEGVTPRRALAATNLILLENALDRGSFRAAYRRRFRTEPPDWPETLDRLLQAITSARPEIKAIAIVGSSVPTEIVERARRVCATETFSSRTDGLRWLLTHRVQWTPSPPSHLERRRIRTLDLGSAGSPMLSSLHDEVRLGVPDSFVRLPGSAWRFQEQLWGKTSTEGLEWLRKIRACRGLEPSPPSWSGAIRSPWRADWSFDVTDFWAQTTSSKVSEALVVRAGPRSLDGEVEFAKFLEQVWMGNVFPAAIIEGIETDHRADPMLAGWLRSEFPDVRVFPDTKDGLLRAIFAVAKMARRSEEVKEAADKVQNEVRT